MDYVRIITDSSNSNSLIGSYKINVSEGVNLRSGPGTNYSKLTAIPYNKTVSVKEEKNGWGKTTYNGCTGWFALQYGTKQSKSRNKKMLFTDNEISAESKIGIIEIYGFDTFGEKLFKMKAVDNQKSYEYIQPEIEFGSKLVLADNGNCPSPKTITTTDNNGKKIEQSIDSGKFGDWNEFIGWFTIERKTVNSKQKWFAKIEKVD